MPWFLTRFWNAHAVETPISRMASSLIIHSEQSVSPMKALLQAGLAGRVPAPPEKRFLITRRRWR
jgi:hypothetical protein